MRKMFPFDDVIMNHLIEIVHSFLNKGLNSKHLNWSVKVLIAIVLSIKMEIYVGYVSSF